MYTMKHTAADFFGPRACVLRSVEAETRWAAYSKLINADRNRT